MAQERPDVPAILSQLKDFQRATVEHVFRRLYLDADYTRRFLVADEVGLGKTLVGRGLIARTVDRLWEQKERIDIVYICSNGDIARQNINRLNVTGQQDFAFASRITLLPLTLRALEQNRINFISFTPDTSFNIKRSTGMARERALLYLLLDRAWQIDDHPGAFEVLRANMGAYGFTDELAEIRRERPSEVLADRFVQSLADQIAVEQSSGQPDIRTRFFWGCERFAAGTTVQYWERQERNRLVGTLRTILAKACLRALQPDLVILDEFQRVKHLLEPTEEASELAHTLFTYSDDNTAARVILLSATPYKMYTLREDTGEEGDHYADFLRTVEFLQDDPGATAQFKDLLDRYRTSLFHLDHETARAAQLKQEVEAVLQRVMVRTERLAGTADRDGMLMEQAAHLTLTGRDLQGYLGLQKVARVMGTPGDTLEYWKSSPYLLNFMDDYALKRTFNQAVTRGDTAQVGAALDRHPSMLLPWEAIHHYLVLDPANARLRNLTEMLDDGAWRLLWRPPALPYYQLGQPFIAAGPRLTKRLVFSTWQVVPKVIATLLSYEAERQIFRSFEHDPENNQQARQRRRRLLNVAVSDNRPSGMPVLGMLYPAEKLARECDPLVLSWGTPPLNEVLARAITRLVPTVKRITERWETVGTEDERWYWAAPILLDLDAYPDATRAWFSQIDLAGQWSNGDPGPGEETDSSGWNDHVVVARDLVMGRIKLGKAPKDLVSFLALLGVAGPGICALRALWRISGRPIEPMTLGNTAAGLAWRLRALFNSLEATALIRGMNRAEPYWRRVLEYAAAGGLQAVLDEYAHVLRESLGLIAQTPLLMVEKIAAAMASALSLRITSLSVAEIVTIDEDVVVEPNRLRSHWARRFGEERGEDGAVTRAEQVRQAFNSPFWPFVLATTSVGQEGLDFHTYCHAVVHWNLPSNPVDLEQREGRVHRYKGHAVRKNVALQHRERLARDTFADPWTGLFNEAREARDPGESDLVPFWVYPVKGGARIERHVPALPLSRDRQRLADLRRSLVVYRMVFGQARQEDLVQYLLARFPEDELAEIMRQLVINLEPEHTVLS